jgi:hypothetical protein
MRARCVTTVALLLALVALPVSAPAQTKAPIRPKLGNWELVQELTPEQAASIADVPPRVLERMGYDRVQGTVRTTLCLNAQTMSTWEAQDGEMRASGKARCDDPVYTVAGDTMTMTFECTAPVQLRMRTAYHFTPGRDAYTYENEVTIRAGDKPVTRRVRGRAKRIGDC